MRKSICTLNNQSELQVFKNDNTGLYDVELDTDDLTLDISLDKSQVEVLITKLMEVAI